MDKMISISDIFLLHENIKLLKEFHFLQSGYLITEGVIRICIHKSPSTSYPLC